MTRNRSRRQQVFLYLFLLGTVIAAVGWIAEWNYLGNIAPLLSYPEIIAGAGHLLQVVGAFGSLLIPERVDRTSSTE
jgi:hypothetical protein